MKVLGSGNRQTRKAYCQQEGEEFFVSPFAEVRGRRRPIGRFDSKEELEAYVASRHHEAVWLDN